MKKLVVGLTGGIGSGKSTVANLFVSRGIDLIDADKIARDVVQPGMPATNAIAEHFGTAVLEENGQLNRPVLRQIVFSDDKAKAWLDALLHPIIRQTMHSAINKAKSAYCMVDVPLLTENKMQSQFDRILVVDCPAELQLQRAMSRDGSSEDTIKRIIASQASREARLGIADDIIENTSTLDALVPKVDALHNKYLTLVSQE
ncbi:dephospho-CoA kinase [Alteromonas sediminis]|uniref:Dephospho-CoA kinase n=1 Tax=Alteromonas sediminis TaxID=2259342 RepID=A0A3N5Y9J8_9ALTE|nr:dephospho-CoA kinase [Alteromonas sediminis]RPJ67959.1 dephospho-CoA kinase [Alteromonas sediminis]